ncbi:MAG: DUF6120 family protein [Terrisporobacter sp.]
MQQSLIIKKYCKEISELLPIHSSREKRFLLDIKNSVIEYGEHNTKFTKEDLLKNIGEPKDLVSKYLLDIDGDTLRKRMNQTRYIRNTSLFIVVVVLLTSLFKIGLDYRSFKEAQDSYINREVITIEEGGE